MNIEADIAVVGAGVGGSLTAAILQRAGFDVVLIDRTKHPRFAIGESSTPAANLLLRHLADRHQLDYLRPLCKYGTWCRELPQVRRGLKRGFSYFKHQSGQPFRATADHSKELIVAASNSDDVGDTQWLRADVDEYLCEQSVQLGVRFLPQTSIQSCGQSDRQSVLQLRSPEQQITLRTGAIINATSGSLNGLWTNLNGGPSNKTSSGTASTFRTNTRAIFGHFKGLDKWSAVIGDCPDHPFACDDSAMHHLLDGAWMWWIRFDDATTSVGLVIDETSSERLREANDSAQSAECEWNAVLARYPSLAHAFRNAEYVTGLFSTGRLQRGQRSLHSSDSQDERSPEFGRTNGLSRAQIVELPNALGFVDPLHSTGLAHTISGVDRVTNAFIKYRDSPEQLAESLSTYTTDVLAELTWIDDLVSGCYRRLDNFSAFSSFAMCYFAAATTFERRFIEQQRDLRFLCSDDKQLLQSVRTLSNRDPHEDSTEFEHACCDMLSPFNHVGLFAPAIRNMYAYTALPE